MLTSAWIIVPLALACTSISYTLTKTPVFDWLRALLPEKGMVRELWQCPYCMSHWVAAALVALTQPYPITGTWVDLPLVAFAVGTLTALLVQAIVLIHELLEYIRSL